MPRTESAARPRARCWLSMRSSRNMGLLLLDAVLDRLSRSLLLHIACGGAPALVQRVAARPARRRGRRRCARQARDAVLRPGWLSLLQAPARGQLPSGGDRREGAAPAG